MTGDAATVAVVLFVALLACAGLGALVGARSARGPIRAASIDLGAALAFLDGSRAQLAIVTAQLQETEASMLACQATMAASWRALTESITALEETRAELLATRASGETLGQVARIALERATGQRFDPNLPDLADLEAMTSGEGVEPPPRDPKPAE